MSPKVGKREFPYDKAGKKAAADWSKKSGKPIKSGKPMKSGKKK